MAITELRKDVKTKTGLILTPIPDDSLSIENPAHVTDDGKEIHVFSQLSEEEQIEAEAHELCHILLEYEGLITLGYNAGAFCPFNNDEYNDIFEWISHLEFVTRELTMAIHHEHIFKRLENIYHVSNQLQIRSRYTPVDEMRNILESCKNFKVLHHGYGFQLLDVEKTICPLSDYLSDLSDDYPEVIKSYNVAKEIFPELSIHKPLNYQLDLCKDILSTLGFDRDSILVKNRSYQKTVVTEA